MKCTKCGSTKNVIHHHEQYKEIHGEDKVVMLCRSCHIKLHIRLRREGRCKVPVAEIQKYSTRAYNETDEQKAYKKEYSKRTPEKLDAIMDQYFSGDYSIVVKLTEEEKNSNLNTTARMKQKEEEARVRNEKIAKRQMGE